MYTQVKEQRRSGLMSSTVVRQRVTFADNRSSSITQRNLCFGIEKQAIQRVPTRKENQKDANIYDVTYSGRQCDFTGGSEPVDVGVDGVQSYAAKVDITCSQHGSKYSNTVGIDANTHEYQEGHMLAKALGGSGKAENIFWQDGGQNTTGDWVSFERKVTNIRNLGSALPMTYRVVLNGPGLTYTF